MPDTPSWTICVCGKCGKRVADETSDDVCICSPIAKPSRPSPPSREIEVVPAEHADALAEAVEQERDRFHRLSPTHYRLDQALTLYRQATHASTGKESDD